MMQSETKESHQRANRLSSNFDAVESELVDLRAQRNAAIEQVPCLRLLCSTSLNPDLLLGNREGMGERLSCTYSNVDLHSVNECICMCALPFHSLPLPHNIPPGESSASRVRADAPEPYAAAARDCRTPGLH
jgi:hypothetical protein